MHDVQARGTRYSLLAAGFMASLFALIGSCVLNFRYGHALARTPEDGLIFGVLAIASDVFMAISLFFYFEAKKNRQYAMMAASLIVWAATTAFAGIAAISQASMNRIDAVAHRATVATTYNDTRQELAQARDQRKTFGTWTRPEATIRAEIEKHKTKKEWTASSECSEIGGKVQREYCANYQTLVADLGSAQQVAKLDKRIEELVAKSDSMSASNAPVASEADPAAATLAGATGYSQRSVQTAIIFGFAGLMLVLCSLGPYITSSLMHSHNAKAEAPPVETLPPVDAPPPPRKLEAKPVPALPKPAELRPVVANEWREVLDLIDFPKPGWAPARDANGITILRDKDPYDTIGWRFFCYLAAHSFVGEKTPAEMEALYAQFAAEDYRTPWAYRIVASELAQITRWIKKAGSPVTWTIVAPPVARLREALDKRKVVEKATPPKADPEPAKAAETKVVTADAKVVTAPEPKKPIFGFWNRKDDDGPVTTH